MLFLSKACNMEDKQISISELETFFRSAQIPAEPFNLNPSHRINNVKFFLDTHFAPLRNKKHPLDLLHKPLYDRLVEFKRFLEKEA